MRFLFQWLSALYLSSAGMSPPTPSMSPTTAAPTVPDKVLVEMMVVPDSAPDEISWSLLSPDKQNYEGRVPGAGGNLPIGTYAFTIRDSGKNGICCSKGQGRYELRVNRKTFITRDGQFGDSETIQFHVDKHGIVSNVRISTSLTPNPGPIPTRPPTTGPSPRGRFNIELVPSTKFNPASLPDTVRALQAAARRWETVIIGDLPDADGVDDLRITYDFSTIDGRGGVLGYAGPNSLRSGSSIPITGSMTFDASDFIELSAKEQEAVFLHEMGHILGIGTVWDTLGISKCRQGTPIYSPANANSNARVAFRTSPGRRGKSELEIESEGGGGTKCSHFDETQLQSELMTGYLSVNEKTGIAELSSITIGALRDIGYEVNYGVAEPFTIPESELNPLEVGSVLKGIDLRGDVLDFDPIYVDSDEDKVLRASMANLDDLLVADDDSSFNLTAFATGGAAVLGVTLVAAAAISIRSRKTSPLADREMQLVEKP